MSIKIKIILICAAVSSMFASCTNVPAAESKKEETAPIKRESAPAFPNVMSNWKVKEGYIIKVQRNDQTEYPIFFKGLQAAIMFDENKPESSKLFASIEASTIETGNNEMNAHAKEESVLNAQLFPIMSFESTVIKKMDTGYEATGKLNMKGITKEIQLPFVFRNDTFMGKFTIGAKDFEITRKGAAPNGQIKIELIIPVTK
ncbi:MAG TPA: YceI family protein [Bacteroidia bacterium]|jgi:polyisoprenoid-binding protein YceI|nr:YceI family protein [Bacteroidia bacterium]